MPPELYPADFRVRPIRSRRATSRFREISTRRTVTMPESASPHVKLVFSEMARLQVTYDEVAEGSGVRRASMKAWRGKNKPSLESLESVLGFLGWAYVPVPGLETLPPELAGELTALALKLGASTPALASMTGRWSSEHRAESAIRSCARSLPRTRDRCRRSTPSRVRKRPRTGSPSR